MSRGTAGRWAVLAAMAALYAVPARAQSGGPPPAAAPMSLEEVLSAEIPSVVGASRFAQQVVDAPATVTIVTSDEIQRFGYRTFADLLRGVRGFYVNYDRNYSYVGSRGFLRPGDYNSRILLLIDGHRVNDNIYDSATIGTDFPIDLELVERVEIVRGPSSSLYGTSAFFAVVNVTTRRGSASHSEAGFAAGSQSALDARVAVARSVGGGDLQLSASQYSSAGEKRVEVDESGLSSLDMDHDRATRVFGTFSKGRWLAEGLYASRTKGIPTGAFGTALSGDLSETTDARGFAGLRYEGAVHGTSLTWSGAYDWYSYEGTYDQAPAPIDDFAYGRWWSSELSATRTLQKHLVTVGTDVKDNVRQDQGAYEPGGAYGETTDWIVDDRRRSWQWAAYAQDEFKVSKRVIVSAGVRTDYWPAFGSTTNPRVGVIFKPKPNASIKLLHGTAFRAPNLYELYYYGDLSGRLRPERIRTSELAWEQYLSGPTRVTVSTFRYRIRDLITQVEQPDAFQQIGFANVGVTDASGAEAEVERNWGLAQLLGSYTFTATRDHDSGQRLSNSPRHLATARATAPLFGRRATIGMEWDYTSERRTITGAVTSGFALGNLTIASGDLPGRLRLSVDVHNVLDERYADPGGEEHVGPIRQDGRTARAKVAWRF